MRKLSLICTAALLATPMLTGSAFAVAGKLDNGQAIALTASGVPSATPRTRLPQASPAVVESMLSAGASTASGDAAGASGGSDGVRAFAGSSPFASQAFGSLGKYPFTTKRAAAWTDNGTAAPGNEPVTEYPLRPTGKLWQRFGNSWFVCTASLIKPGVLVTAAHCVHNFGQGQAGFADQVLWYPAAWASSGAGAAPYGVYRARAWYVLFQYYNGTDSCSSAGVVCSNDLALVILWNNNNGQALNNETQAGNVTGWYGYGWNGYSFVTSPYIGNAYAGQITQLGYPVALDSGYKHERTDSVARYTVTSNGTTTYNLIWGSSQTGGSSGGPEIVNFGTPPTYGSGGSEGQQAGGPTVVGVTSWGYIDINRKIQGASWFGQNIQYPNANYGGYGAGNIGYFVRYICTHATWAPQCV